MQDLTARTAVITGAGSGIGRATALAFAAEGVSVVVADLDTERCETVTAEIEALGGQALAQATDVTSDEQVAELRQRAIDRFGQVDIVMSNVGVLTLGQPAGIPIEAWFKIVDTNLLSVARCINAFLPDLITRGEGHIVNTASTAGLYGYSFERLPYSATKGAVVAMTEALALYCRPRGVGVTLLCPGPVATKISEQITVHGEVGPIQRPDLEILDPVMVGRQVVDAIRRDRFFLPTHEEVYDILVERAADLDGFVDRQAAKLV